MNAHGNEQPHPTRVHDCIAVDTLVIGAGVVGLAVARALARQGREVLVVEAGARFGEGISSRNSEVIHAGLYYPPGSLKARLCVRGKQLLYEYCQARGIPYRRCGKLIVATCAEQEARLYAIEQRAVANGVDDLQWQDTRALAQRVPQLQATAALHSPSTGIVDSHQLMLALLADVEAAGGQLACRAPVQSGRIEGGRLYLHIGGPSPCELVARRVVNAAGLQAAALLRTIEGYPEHTIPALHYAKGSYFMLSGHCPFRQLIYPVPEPGGLGVHLTLDLAGQARFGPDVEWVAEPDYHVDPNRATRFREAISRYWPGIRGRELYPAYAGVRPKLAAAGEADRDFAIQGEETLGLSGWVNLLGIESPGLTSALAIAEMVRDYWFK